MAHTTRAYMSEPGGGRRSRFPFIGDDGSGIAFAEALAILADVEPRTGDWAQPNGAFMAFYPLQASALLESLAAFVNDGGRA